LFNFTGTPANGVWEAGIQDYKGMKNAMIGASGNGVNGFETFYDEQAQAAYVWNKSNGTLATYDSPRSVNAKGQYVRSLGLAGLFSWEIDADNGDILNAMHEGLAGGAPVNQKPVIQLTANYSVEAGDPLIVAATATDADNDPLSYSWVVDDAFAATGKNTNTLALTAPNVSQNTAYTLTLSVFDGTVTVTKSTTVTVLAGGVVNHPPVIADIADVSLDENKTATVSVNATDVDNDSLTYRWSVPAGLTLQGSGANISLLAGEVSQNTPYTVSVSVSDGTHNVEKRFTVTVNNVDGGGDTTWLATTIYNTGNKVTYQGVEYRAKWWTQGDRPDAGGVWEVVIADGNPVANWKLSSTYNGGDKVMHNNEKYQAKWWTKGDEPGVSNVWQKL
jgi:chitinase